MPFVPDDSAGALPVFTLTNHEGNKVNVRNKVSIFTDYKLNSRRFPA